MKGFAAGPLKATDFHGNGFEGSEISGNFQSNFQSIFHLVENKIPLISKCVR